MNTSIDVRDVLGVVSAPTLVVHQRADPWVRVEHGRYLAGHIPGAAYVELDGDEHIPTAGRVPELLSHMVPFLQEAASRPASSRTSCWRLSCSPTLSDRQHGRPNWEMRNGGSCWPSTMRGFAGSWPGTAAWRSTLPVTDSSPDSMGLPADPLRSRHP